MFLTLIGSLLGGIFRLAPEILKFMDKKGDRAHELAMFNAEMQLAQIRGEIAMKQAEAGMTIAELEAMREAFKEQGATSVAAGPFWAAINASVRPIVTYGFVLFYFFVKLASFIIAVDQDGNWKEVLINLWNPEDMGILSMILTFWFVVRVFDRLNHERGA